MIYGSFVKHSPICNRIKIIYFFNTATSPLCFFFFFFFLAATKQLYGWLSPSVCPSVRLSVCLWHIFHYVPLIVYIMKFSGVITDDKSDVHAKGQGQRAKIKVTEVTAQLNRFWTVTPVGFTNDDEMMNEAWCCLVEVSYCFSRSSVKFQSHTAK